MSFTFETNFHIAELAKPVFNYSDIVVFLAYNESLQWTQEGYYDDFRVSYSEMSGAERPEYYITNGTFVTLERLNIEIGPVYKVSVCARQGEGCATYSTNLYMRGTLHDISVHHIMLPDTL